MNPNMPYYPPYGSYMPIPPEELQKQAERTALKRRGAGIGLGIIGMLAVSFVLSALLFGTAAALAGDISSGDPDFQYLNPTLYYALYMILYVLMVVTPFAVLIPIFRLRLRDVCPLHRTAHPGIIALAAVGGLAVCMVSNWMTNEYVTLLSAFGIENAPSEMPIDDSVAGHILRVPRRRVSSAAAIRQNAGDFRLGVRVRADARQRGADSVCVCHRAVFRLCGRGNRVAAPGNGHAFSEQWIFGDAGIHAGAPVGIGVADRDIRVVPAGHADRHRSAGRRAAA